MLFDLQKPILQKWVHTHIHTLKDIHFVIVYDFLKILFLSLLPDAEFLERQYPSFSLVTSEPQMYNRVKMLKNAYWLTNDQNILCVKIMR